MCIDKDILVLSDIVLGMYNVGYIFSYIQNHITKDLEFWRRQATHLHTLNLSSIQEVTFDA